VTIFCCAQLTSNLRTLAFQPVSSGSTEVRTGFQ
jgi:hypothetical protein